MTSSQPTNADLLLKLLHTTSDHEVAATLSVEQWQAVTKLAARQRVAPLLAMRLQGSAQEHVPTEIWQFLASRLRNNALKNMLLLSELRTIAEACRAHKVPLIMLKGIDLASSVYENIALREMVDIDLLVLEKDVAKMAAILSELGYTPIAEHQSTARKHLPRHHNESGVPIEAHWTFLEAEQAAVFDFDALWGRAEYRPISDITIQALAPSDLLFHLCIHATYQHLFRLGLRALCDVSAVVSAFGERFDWELFAENALHPQWRNGIYLNLALAKQLLGVDIPNETLTALRPASVDETLLTDAQALLFADKKLSDANQISVAKWHEAASRWDKLKYAGERLFVPRNVLAYQHGLSANSPRLLPHYYQRFRYLFTRYSGQLTATEEIAPDALKLITQQKKIVAWLEE